MSARPPVLVLSAAARGLLHRVLHWAPVWVPLVLLCQFAWLGWKPARAEAERLERERTAVVERHTRLRERHEHMQAELAAWNDPVYRERLRALLREGH